MNEEIPQPAPPNPAPVKKKGFQGLPLKIIALLSLGAPGSLFIISFAITVALVSAARADPAPDKSAVFGHTYCKSWGSAPAGFQTAFEKAANRVGIQPALLASIFLSEHGDTWPASSAVPQPGSKWPRGGNGKGAFQIENWENFWKQVKQFGYNGGKETDPTNPDDPTSPTFASPDNLDDASMAAAVSLMVGLKKKNIPLDTTEEKFIMYAGLYHNRGADAAFKWADDGFDLTTPPVNTEHPEWAWGANDYAKRTWANFNGLNNECVSYATVEGTNGGDDHFINNLQNGWLTAENDKGKKMITGTMIPTGIVLHWTAGDSVDSAVSAMTSRFAYVHLIIDKNGKVTQLLPFDKKVRSGSGDGNPFAIGIEIVSTSNNDISVNEQTLLDNDKQYQSVLKTVQYLIKKYNIPNVKGSPTNLEAKKGIYGHLQLQSKNGSWEGLEKGCKSTKSDPGKTYLRKIWQDLGSEGSGDCLG